MKKSRSKENESQKHGFIFENQILDEKLNVIRKIWRDISNNYTSRWDFPPIQIKSFKIDNIFLNSTIELSDIKRNFENNDGYFLILVGYEQIIEKNIEIKKVVFSDAIFIDSKMLKKLKGEITLDIIENWNKKLKSFPFGKHFEARKWASSEREKIKKEYPNTKYKVRFKIDSNIQRRIQASIKLEHLYHEDKINNGIFDIKKNKLGIKSIDSSPRKRTKNR